MEILLIGAFLLGLLVGRKNSIVVKNNHVYLSLDRDIRTEVDL